MSKCGIAHWKVHTARHTFASMMLAENTAVSYVSKILGHSSIQMTVDIYCHLLPDRDKSTVNILDKNDNIDSRLVPLKQDNPTTSEDYRVIYDMVAMQGISKKR